MRRDILVVFGGVSTEHDISIITGVSVLHEISTQNNNLIPVYYDESGFFTGKELFDINFFKTRDTKSLTKVELSGKKLYTLSKCIKRQIIISNNIDCALLCTHGGDGEDGTLQGYLEINNIPYTSCNVFNSASTMDKIITKKLLKAINIATVRGYGFCVDEENIVEEAEAITKKLKHFPLIIKPAKQGSSIGINIANNMQELIYGIQLASKYSQSVLVEEALTNFLELNIAAVKLNGEIILSSIERVFAQGDILSYDDKYLGEDAAKGIKNTRRQLPAEISSDISEKINQITTKIYKTMQLKGIIRIDLLLSSDNTIYVNEINSIPGSLALYLFLNYPKATLLDGIITEAINDKNNDTTIKKFVSNVLSENNSIKK